jgi:adenine phosphoribosyltransferase
MTLSEIQALIRDVPDFPKPGILFKDITPLLADANGFRAAIDALARLVEPLHADGILAIESRGFIFGAALAQRMGLPLQLVRKRGKLPRKSLSMEYSLEYGVDHLEMHTDAVRPGGRYLVVDDVIATGGTAEAVAKMVALQGAEVAACVFLIELKFLDGRRRLPGKKVISLITY